MTALVPAFVEEIPEELSADTLYVSVVYRTTAHLCCCGCGHEVVAPLSPTDWSITFDGVSVSLSPSIGNWNFPCRSHYWIVDGQVRWARPWTDREIRAGRARDTVAKNRYYSTTQLGPPVDVVTNEPWRVARKGSWLRPGRRSTR